MSTTQTEKQFVSTYLQLINLSNDVKADEFNSTSDYHKVDSLGPTLPKINVILPKASYASGNERTITVKIKSIKPPYKFNSELNNIPSSSTIFKLKTELIKTVPVLSEAGITAGSIKLLVKGKVSSDALPLDSLSSEDEISFMAMIGTLAHAEPVVKESTSENAQKDENDGTISESTWEKIYSLIKEDVKSEEIAKDYISKFRKA